MGFFVGDALGCDLYLGGAVDDLDVLIAQGTDNIVQLVGGDVGGQGVVDLVVREEALALACLDELLEGLPVPFAALGACGRRVSFGTAVLSHAGVARCNTVRRYGTIRATGSLLGLDRHYLSLHRSLSLLPIYRGKGLLPAP